MQRDGEAMETLTDFMFWGSIITADGDCVHKINKKCFLLGGKVMTTLGSILKSRDITFLCTDHVTDHALITWLSCTVHLADPAMIT